MSHVKYAIAFLGFIIVSCSFNSAFFAVKKQNMNSEIRNLNYDEIIIESKDGHKVLCHLYKPSEAVLGTIFLLQGSGDNLASWSTDAQYFVNGGYEVFMMEYRGFGADSGKATHKNVLIDAEIALLHLTNMKSVKGGKIIMLGQSYGGQIAINLTSRYPEKVVALITEGTFTSFNKEVVYQVPFIIKPFLKILAKSPYKSEELIREIKGVPVLIIHSKEDRTVPFNMGQALYSNANEPKYFWEINGEHIHGIENYPKEYMEKISMLIQGNTPGKK